MNSLSWFLYLADVIGGSKPTIGLIIGLIFTSVSVWGIIASYAADVNDNDGPKKALLGKLPLLIGVVVGLLIINVLLPSKETIYLIAGSEAGEYVVTSPEGQEIINDIKAIIKSQIEELKE